MKSLKKNLTYQTIYQVLVTITPLITSPYLSRKLGAAGLGIYSYTQSIVNYFVLFAMLGFINYGTRTIVLFISLIGLMIGVISLYLIRMYKNSLQRPHYIIKEKIGFKATK